MAAQYRSRGADSRIEGSSLRIEGSSWLDRGEFDGRMLTSTRPCRASSHQPAPGWRAIIKEVEEQT